VESRKESNHDLLDYPSRKTITSNLSKFRRIDSFCKQKKLHFIKSPITYSRMRYHIHRKKMVNTETSFAPTEEKEKLRYNPDLSYDHQNSTQWKSECCLLCNKMSEQMAQLERAFQKSNDENKELIKEVKMLKSMIEKMNSNINHSELESIINKLKKLNY